MPYESNACQCNCAQELYLVNTLWNFKTITAYTLTMFTLISIFKAFIIGAVNCSVTEGSGMIGLPIGWYNSKIYLQYLMLL